MMRMKIIANMHFMTVPFSLSNVIIARTLAVMVYMLALPSFASSNSKIDLIEKYLTEGRSTQDNVEAMRLFIAADGESRRSGIDSLQFWALYEIGRTYYGMQAWGEALDNFSQAYEVCRNAKLGTKEEMYVLNGIAAVYDDEGNNAKAIQIAEQCLQKAIGAKDTFAIITYYNNIATSAQKLKDYKYARRMLDAADSLYNTHTEATMTDLVRCDLYYETKQYNDCLELAYRLITSSIMTNAEKSSVMAEMSDILIKQEQYDKAAALITEALPISTLRDRWKFYDYLSKIHQVRGSTSAALLYSDSAMLFKDSLYTNSNKQLERASQFKLDAMMLRSNYEEQIRTYKNRTKSILSISIFLIVIAIIYIYNRHQKNKQNRKLMDLQMEDERSKKMLAEQKMHETQLIATYQQNLLQQKIEQKRRELEMNTMFISSRNALIEELLTSISNIEEIADNRELKNIIRHTRQTIGNANDHDEFLAKFQEANPEFIATLRKQYPQLTSSDIRYLVYVKMDIPSKEIAAMLNISPSSCKQKKTRVAKKLHLEDATQLRQFLYRI